MASKNELQLAHGLWIILLVVGAICFLASPAETPDPPVRIMLKNMAGKVLFDHKVHTEVRGYGLSCVDCHHTNTNDDPRPDDCGECHKAEKQEKEGKMVIKRLDAFHQQCEKCHKDYDIGPEKDDDRCSWCHML
jgi:hypothetical protein